MRRNKLMTLALAVICGVSVMTTSIKAETMYFGAENGGIAHDDEETIVMEQLEDEQVRNFVKRLYQVILNREAEEDGLNAWTKQLLDRKATGAQLVGGFVESDEFMQRGLSNEEVVEIMYQAMLGRASDEVGKAGWSKILNNGCSYLNIVNGFSGSVEFNQICGDYGITAGTVELNRQRDKNPQLTAFVARCYTEALDRQYEVGGLEAWCDAIISGRNTPKQVAQMFIFSDEFLQKNLSSEEYVKVLYRTFMGREADETGLTGWIGVLESGREDRMKVLEGFSDSVEFDGILQTFGLSLGTGTENNGEIESANMVKMVSLGSHHSAAITKDGSLYMWGLNGHGELGDETTNNSLVPKKILENVETVSLRSWSSAAITKDGSLYMWGKNNNHGELGDGTTNNSLVPKKILENVETVSLGSYHNAAITKDGNLYMWGDNQFGKLGDGTTNDSLEPKKILENVETVSLGYFHSAAITKDGSLYMWGSNSVGELGDGTTNDSLEPKKILENVETVSLGYSWSAAITKDGSLYTWGSDDNSGQLGNGTETVSLVPQKILENVVTVSMGNYYSAAITKDGSLYMWGINDRGQLGDGTINNSLVPKKILENVKTVSLDGGWSSAAITKDGSLYMWGGNSGQLGDGTENDSLVPKKILEDVETVVWNAAFSAAVTKDGSLHMWGWNGSGQLGNGTTDASLTPTKVEFP